MTANEIREELHKNSVELFPEVKSSVDKALGLLQYSAQMEIAAQLAELNERLWDWDIETSTGAHAVRTITPEEVV